MPRRLARRCARSAHPSSRDAEPTPATAAAEESRLPHALDGINVIDLAINYAGPATSMYLADQGANVIKIERRVVGDTARRAGNTPFLKLNSRHFMAINRGKRGMTLDITKTEGQ